MVTSLLVLLTDSYLIIAMKSYSFSCSSCCCFFLCMEVWIPSGWCATLVVRRCCALTKNIAQRLAWRWHMVLTILRIKSSSRSTRTITLSCKQNFPGLRFRQSACAAEFLGQTRFRNNGWLRAGSFGTPERGFDRCPYVSCLLLECTAACNSLTDTAQAYM